MHILMRFLDQSFQWLEHEQYTHREITQYTDRHSDMRPNTSGH